MTKQICVKKPLLTLGLLAILPLYMACAKTYRLSDADGNDIEVKGPRFEPKSMELRTGKVRRGLQADEILFLQVNPSQVTSIDGKVFYGVELLLEDSVKVENARLVMDGRVYADHKGTAIEIPMAELRSLRRVEKDDAVKDSVATKPNAVADPDITTPPVQSQP